MTRNGGPQFGACLILSEFPPPRGKGPRFCQSALPGKNAQKRDLLNFWAGGGGSPNFAVAVKNRVSHPQRKATGQQLKGKIVSAPFHTFPNF